MVVEYKLKVGACIVVDDPDNIVSMALDYPHDGITTLDGSEYSFSDRTKIRSKQKCYVQNRIRCTIYRAQNKIL